MYNVENIMSLLNEGMTAEEIAKSFTEALNKAVQEKKETDTRKYQKHADMKSLLEDVLIYINTYHPNVLPEVKEVDDEDVDELIKAFDDVVPQLETLADMVKELPAVRKVKIRTAPSAKAADDIIKDFLKLHNL